MSRAVWQDVVLAETDRPVVVEGNHYFPPDSVNWSHLKSSDKQTVCPWKGIASYYHVEVNGQRNPDAAWCYPKPMEAAEQIKGYVAFWKGIRVEP